MPLNNRAITEVIDAISSDDPVASVPATWELVDRWEECRPYVSEVILLLRNEDAAIADIAWHVLFRLRDGAVKPILSSLSDSTNGFRRRLIGLLVAIADLSIWLPIVHLELQGRDEAMRYFAADCIGRAYDPNMRWPKDAVVLLNEAVEILWTASRPENREAYWSQARMTLKHLKLLDSRVHQRTEFPKR